MRDVTVVIPLHLSAAWVDNVAANVGRLAGLAEIIISDPFELDGALSSLRRRLGSVPHVTFAGRRPLRPGWPAHYNDLFGMARTPFVMVLAHDDEIDGRWVAFGRRALATAPAAVLAVGELVDRDHRRPRIPLRPEFTNPIASERVRAATSMLVHDGGALGLAMRGIFRREGAAGVPEDIPGDEFADAYWAIAMLTHGRFVPIPGALYLKRFREDGTHVRWGPLDREAMGTCVAEAIRAGSAPGDWAGLIEAAWHADRSDLLAEIGHRALARSYARSLRRVAGSLRRLVARRRP